jgi:hypothetical protein
VKQVNELFDQNIHRRIEKVIQYQTTEKELLRQEVSEYVVTDNIEQSLEKMLDALDTGFGSPSEEEIGVWVSGFYGSGKSSFTKYLGYALDASYTVGDTLFRDLFKNRITNQPLQQRLSTVATRHEPAVIMIDLSTAQAGGKTGEPISSVVFRRVLLWAGYSEVTKHALLELQLEEDGRTEELYQAVKERGREWEKIRNNEIVGGGIASQIATEIYPDIFPDQKAFQQLKISDMDQDRLVRRIMDLVERRTGNRKMMIILDEAGQYVAARGDLVLNLQGLVQNFKAIGKGRAWIVATAQQTLTDTVDAINAPQLFKLKDRFPISIELKADDIQVITHRRLLSKKGDARQVLEELYEQYGAKLNVRTRLENARGYTTSVEKEQFLQLYPFLPQHFDLMMNIISRLAKSTGGTGLRSAIKVVQETLIGEFSGAPFVNRPVGSLVTIVDFFNVLHPDMESAPSYKHTVSAVEKAENRYGKDGMETRVAKAVAVMQVLDDFPLSRHNLAALLVAGVGEDTMQEEVDAAVDTLRKDTTIPLEEIDGRLWFLSDRSAELQRDWRDMQPNSNDQRQVLADVLRESVQPADPKATVFSGKQVKGSVILNYLDYPRTLSSGNADLDVEYRFVSPTEFDGARQTAKDESVTPTADKRVIVLGAIKPDVQEHIRDAYASTKMQARLRSGTRDADEEEFYKSLDGRSRTARQRIADALKVALAQGSVIWRGQDVAVQHGASSFESALTNALMELGKEVFSHYPNAAVTPNGAAAEKIIKAKDPSTIGAAEDPLNLLAGGKGGSFNSGSPAVTDVQDYINRHGSVEGKQLLDDFAGPPYGWNKDVTRYVVAAMFVGSEISLRINGQQVTATNQSVVDAFKSNQAFAKIGIDAPPEPPEQAVVLQAQHALMQLTGKNINPIPKSLEAEARELIPRLIAQARDVARRADALDLGVSQEARKVVDELTNLQSADQNSLIRAFGQEDKSLLTRLQRVTRLHDLLSGSFGELLSRLRERSKGVSQLPESGRYGELKAETKSLREDAENLLGDTDLEARQPELQQIAEELEKLLKAAVADERASLSEEAPAKVESLEKSPEWSSLDPDSRESFLPRLEALRDPLPPETSDPLQELRALQNARFELMSGIADLQEAIRKKAEEVEETKEQKTAVLSIPAGELSRSQAESAISKLQDSIGEIPEETPIRFRLGE